MIQIGIIDCGIDNNHRKLQKCSISGISVRISREGKEVLGREFSDNHGHGTACAYIIHKIIPEAELVAIKIFNKNQLTKEDTFVAALKWCLSQPNLRLINVSLGVSNELPHHTLTEICKEAYEKGKIIVAAAHNEINQKSFPASFPWVISVLSGHIKLNTDYGYIQGSENEFIGKGSIQRVAWCNNQDKIVTGTSFAAPHITGIIGQLLIKNQALTFQEILKHLINGANNQIKPIQFVGHVNSFHSPTIVQYRDIDVAKELIEKNRFAWIKKIAVFPTSEKEMKQFADFQQQCVFRISQFIDYPKTFNTFKTKQNVSNNSLNIKQRLLTNKEFNNINTFVLGYYYDNLWEGNVAFGNDLVELAVEKGKNFFVYDFRIFNYLKEKIQRLKVGHNQIVYMPLVNNDTFKKTSIFQYLPPVKCPIIMVIGTGNKQGKFTTQLRLKSILQNSGYKVSHLTTEPQGELFGADFCYPYGYMSTVDLKSTEQVLLLRNVLKLIYKFLRPDIILTGCQGGFLPAHPLLSIPYLGASESLSFLYGVLPDIIICAINPEDKIEKIRNIVKIAQIYSKCHIIFYVLTPRVGDRSSKKIKADVNGFLTNESFEDRKSYFESHLKRPVFNIMDNKNDSLIIKLIENVCS